MYRQIVKARGDRKLRIIQMQLNTQVYKKRYKINYYYLLRLTLSPICLHWNFVEEELSWNFFNLILLLFSLWYLYFMSFRRGWTLCTEAVCLFFLTSVCTKLPIKILCRVFTLLIWKDHHESSLIIGTISNAQY